MLLYSKSTTQRLWTQMLATVCREASHLDKLFKVELRRENLIVMSTRRLAAIPARLTPTSKSQVTCSIQKLTPNHDYHDQKKILSK